MNTKKGQPGGSADLLQPVLKADSKRNISPRMALTFKIVSVL
jgi:hypothetical protein